MRPLVIHLVEVGALSFETDDLIRCLRRYGRPISYAGFADLQGVSYSALWSRLARTIHPDEFEVIAGDPAQTLPLFGTLLSTAHVVLVDGRGEEAQVRALLRQLAAVRASTPIVIRGPARDAVRASHEHELVTVPLNDVDLLVAPAAAFVQCRPLRLAAAWCSHTVAPIRTRT
jgi:hypothetical protein